MGVDRGPSRRQELTMAPAGLRYQPVEREGASMSKTHTYRKIVKPMIEKRRRDRVNSYLDELKDLMLSLNPGLDLDRFHAGYTACATEVSRSLAASGVDVATGSRLMGHLGHKLNTIERERVAPLSLRMPEHRVPKHLRLSSPVSDAGYSSGGDSSPSPQPLLQISPSYSHSQASPVWRPF